MKWISVNDRLPNDINPVLTYGKARGGRQITIAWYNDMWKHFVGNGKCKREITHWMPLPAPPVDQIKQPTQEAERSAG